jgi:hypothetical protein
MISVTRFHNEGVYLDVGRLLETILAAPERRQTL